MLDFVPNLLAITATILFPTYASYKALCTHDPALLTPWLTYFLTLSLLTTVESLFSFFLSYLPFYAWLRLVLHLYLLLPGEHQGATFLYTTHIRPFLAEHDAQIEHFISTGHDRVKAVGLDYLKRAVNYVRALLLGEAGQQQVESESTSPQPIPPAALSGQQQSYAQLLLQRFSLPNARPMTPLPPPTTSVPPSGPTAAQSDIYALLSSVLAAATSSIPSSSNPTNPSAPAPPNSSPTIPPTFSTPTDQLSYLRNQTERLRALLGAFDKQAEAIAANDGTESLPSSAMKKSKSEAEFEAIEHGDATAPPLAAPAASISPVVEKKAWGVWGWGSSGGAKKSVTADGPYASEAAEGKQGGRDAK